MIIFMSRNNYLLNDLYHVNKLLLIEWIKTKRHNVQESYSHNSCIHESKKNMSVIGTMYAVYTQVPMTICFSRNGYLLNDSCSVNKLLLIQWIKYQYSVQERYMILNSSVHKL